MNSKPKINPWLRDIATYIPGSAPATSSSTSSEQVFKLSSNESALGPSPLAVKAYHEASANLAEYPDSSARQLRHDIANRWNLEPERIICGFGSDDLLLLVTRAYLTQDQSAVCSKHGFLLYPLMIRSVGASAIVVPEIRRTTSVEAIVEAMADHTKMIFIANPNNPTGTMLDDGELAELHSRIPQDVILVIDGAYAEYLDCPEQFPGLNLVRSATNVLMTRTFSKLYGLASLRVGWAYGSSEIIGAMHKVRSPFNVSVPAQAAASAALADIEHDNNSRAHNTQWRRWLTNELTTLGCEVTPSKANFLLVDFASGTHRNATAAAQALAANGITVREMDQYHLPNSLRITVGSEAACRHVAKVLSEFLK